ncbi:hypothetical protein K450DRAFT_229953 [Umbelopsis ramanniana AG]|uniref:Uncharacterized protein n=1 Tax=Umbelopsis ramanniana AG TaxID=1314678 RepID=A0AAD5EF77_UMBRA|nr:uncharacterized protein K450DRAFT_229953 [Umbelopsis ramanniana AG]KAI8581930.1 hypothetical protein K450DRAFT_229953 [Umbelopsis ramanniana AG]
MSTVEIDIPWPNCYVLHLLLLFHFIYIYILCITERNASAILRYSIKENHLAAGALRESCMAYRILVFLR